MIHKSNTVDAEIETYTRINISWNQKAAEETLGSVVVYTDHLDYDDDFTGAYIRKNLSDSMVLRAVDFTSIKILIKL